MTINRRAFLNACTSAGIASPLLPGILYTLAAQAQEAAPSLPLRGRVARRAQTQAARRMCRRCQESRRR